MGAADESFFGVDRSATPNRLAGQWIDARPVSIREAIKLLDLKPISAGDVPGLYLPLLIMHPRNIHPRRPPTMSREQPITGTLSFEGLERAWEQASEVMRDLNGASPRELQTVLFESIRDAVAREPARPLKLADGQLACSKCDRPLQAYFDGKMVLPCVACSREAGAAMVLPDLPEYGMKLRITFRRGPNPNNGRFCWLPEPCIDASTMPQWSEVLTKAGLGGCLIQPKVTMTATSASPGRMTVTFDKAAQAPVAVKPGQVWRSPASFDIQIGTVHEERCDEPCHRGAAPHYHHRNGVGWGLLSWLRAACTLVSDVPAPKCSACKDTGALGMTWCRCPAGQALSRTPSVRATCTAMCSKCLRVECCGESGHAMVCRCYSCIAGEINTAAVHMPAGGHVRDDSTMSTPADVMGQDRTLPTDADCRLGCKCPAHKPLRQPWVPSIDEYDLLPDAG